MREDFSRAFNEQKIFALPLGKEARLDVARQD